MSAPETTLERWGLPTADRIAQRVADGYWTPWHIAAERIAELEADVLLLSVEVRVQAAANNQHKADTGAAVLAEREAIAAKAEQDGYYAFAAAIRARPAP